MNAEKTIDKGTRRIDDPKATDRGIPPEKSVDLPPFGPRNPDPLTDQPGSHPIETGIGAALAGAASGLAVGSVAGPVGTVIGTVVGAIAGGLAGKGVGELIDPTTEDNWIREASAKRTGDPTDENWESLARQAYRFGWRSESRYAGLTFSQIEQTLRADWEAEYPNRPWIENRAAVSDGFQRGRALNGTKD